MTAWRQSSPGRPPASIPPSWASGPIACHLAALAKAADAHEPPTSSIPTSLAAQSFVVNKTGLGLKYRTTARLTSIVRIAILAIQSGCPGARHPDQRTLLQEMQSAMTHNGLATSASAGGMVMRSC